MRAWRIRRLGVIALMSMCCGQVAAVEWESLPYTWHSTYQAVNDNGASAYAGGFPLRMRGVVLANTEDWLDPTPGYTSGYQAYVMGGEAELIIQSVEAGGDFGGTFCWMGQNYGNLPFKGDPVFSYTDAQWVAELGRLHILGGDGVNDPIRAGDLIEVRARIGVFYGGKRNINEAHSIIAANDFEVVVLQRGFGLPTPAALVLSDLKDPADVFIFDPARIDGPEHYQATRVELNHVRFTADSIAAWGTDAELMLEDETGRTLGIHLGLNPSFEMTPAPAGWFDVVGILDQADGDVPHDGGYRLLAMNAADFTAVPEPAALTVVAMGVISLVRRPWRKAA